MNIERVLPPLVHVLTTDLLCTKGSGVVLVNVAGLPLYGRFH